MIAPDLLGHGESAKPLGDYSLGAYASGLRDLVVGALGIERATLVGQSLGGGVAMQLAYQHPGALRAPRAGRQRRPRARGELGPACCSTLPGAEAVMPLLFPRFLREPGEKLAAFFQRLRLRAPHVAEMWSAYASLTETENRHAFLRTLRAVIDPRGQSVSALDRLYLAASLPTLIVWGEQDSIIPVEHAHAAHEILPHSRLEVFEGAGHFVHVEQPLRFAEVLRDFIESTTPARRDVESYRDLLLARAS